MQHLHPVSAQPAHTNESGNGLSITLTDKPGHLQATCSSSVLFRTNNSVLFF